ncbi:hypothetical protein RJ640_030407 [Escallonia rubra]|uniref:HTH myb-type domain-containing protein n=1 Tax=Escallonia rubra TaxID=112253 RepID=A0AA88QMK5_9ASTE|nr:hypothetical protein RJ640_030407 [Escallonia rubra]
MVANSPEFVPKTISAFLADLSVTHDFSEKVTMVKELVHVLENELKKIDAFKRELPVSVLLLQDAIERLKEEVMHGKEMEAQHVVEELKGNSDENGGVKRSTDPSDMKNWLSSAKLWSTNLQHDFHDDSIKEQNFISAIESREKEDAGSYEDNPPQIKSRKDGGAFMEKQSGVDRVERKEIVANCGLSLSLPAVGVASSSKDNGSSGVQSQPQPAQKKHRRCWSPELHRRFVNSLQHLGGPQVATPKQIRELMQVDDLTNDEVKSHLQKYRIHTRKLPTSSAPPSSCLRLGRDSGSPEGPLYLPGSVKGLCSLNTCSNSMEDDGDDKSESHGWRGWLRKPSIFFSDQVSSTQSFLNKERSMREIVTLQVGTYANFIGSHFWNFQGILTYTPRLVSVDIQDTMCRTGNVSTHASEPRKKNLFLQSLDEDEQERVHNEPQSKVPDKDIVESLENDVQFWTDYSKVHYHPQSLYELNGLCMGSQEFNNYGVGRDAFSRGLQGEEINERLRFFIEECDHIQGIQFMLDNTGGFSGLAAEFLESVADEFTNVPVLVYAVQAPESYTNARGQKQTISRKLHDAISFSRLSSLSKLIVPVGLPSVSRSDASRVLCIKDEKPYHSSAVYASAIHSISLPFRMKRLGPTAESCYGSGAMDVHEAIQMLAGQARQNRVAILDVAMPAPSLSGKQAPKFLLGNLQPLTPETAEDMEDSQALESMSIHGVLGYGNFITPSFTLVATHNRGGSSKAIPSEEVD